MSLQPGAILAHKYRIVRTIGQGGMGVVIEAMHEELDQRVAVKLMAEHAAANAEWAARFQREARAAARIKGEHVVRVYDVGKLETGQPYMVMELLDGHDLGAIIEQSGKLEVTTAIDYVLQACEALAEAHAGGIVHRDLKPANLFVTSKSDGSACVKVLDFGISKVTGDMRGVTVTSTSAIVGSPLYMSPEQMKASKNVDARTDIWSLGVILHELITGRPPFEGETAPELCALVLTAPPSRLSERLPTAHPDLEAVVLRCLEKDATKRFKDVADLASALSPFASPAGKISAERVARILLTKARQQSLPSLTERPETARIAITPDKTDVASDIGDTVASGPKIDVPQGPTMLSPGQGRQKGPQPTQKLPPQEHTPAPKAPTLVQAPIASATDSGITERKEPTAAAWGASDTGAKGLDAPKKRSVLPFVLAGAGLLVLGGIAIAVSMSNTSSSANTPPPPPVPVAITKPAETTTATPTTAATAEIDAGTSIDIASLPKATATQGRTTTTTKPTSSVKVKPTSDTSEFGGRK